MRIEIEGDESLAAKFLPAAKTWFMELSNKPGLGGTFKRKFLIGDVLAEVTCDVGRQLDTIHVKAEYAYRSGAGQAPHILSGATILESQSTPAGLEAFAPTVNTKEQFNYPNAYLIHPSLNVASHIGVPSRLGQIGRADTQYSVQNSSKYTGKMSRLVQVILSYGILSVNSAYSQAIAQFVAQQPPGFVMPKSVLWVKENMENGVQNTFSWEYGRTHGVFTNPAGKHWLIEVSNTTGIKAMPLQLEPVTTMPEFRAFVLSKANGAGEQGWWDDVLTILDEFGGFPSNQAFLSKEQSIKDQIVTILPASSMSLYTNSRGATQDIGWAFNEQGDKADNVCFEAKQDTSWYMAHHCRIQIGWGSFNGRPEAVFYPIESGAAPTGLGRFKVGSTVWEGCVSYNLDQTIPGNYSERPYALQTPMHVFWKNGRLEVLRWCDGKVIAGVNKSETSVSIGNRSKTTTTKTWTGNVGIAAGFFCTHHDARVHPAETYILDEHVYTVEHEHERKLIYNPATDDPEYFARTFYAYTTTRQRIESNYRTEGCCAFVPLGDRSAFYITTMVTSGATSDTRNLNQFSTSDPYSYLARSTYLWNWDFGTQCGKSFPVTYAGLTYEGKFYTVWDRDGGNGEAQADKYCLPFCWGPMPYKGHPSWYAWSPAWQAMADEWTALTGESEWFSPGVTIYDTDSSVTPYGGNPPAPYTNNQGERSTLTVYIVSMHETKEIVRIEGPRGSIFTNYFYWFDPSPNSNGVLQTMWAFNNRFGDKHYQLFSLDVNNSNLWADPSYNLPNNQFPTFIGVVGTINAP